MELISPIPACFFGAHIVDIIERKKTILITALPYFISWLMVAHANSALTLCIARLEDDVKKQYEKRRSVFDLFKNSYQRSVGIIVILRNSQQLSGLTVTIFYTLSIFSEAGDFLSPLTATTVYVNIQCIMTGVYSIAIDKTGRGPLLIISIIDSAI
ncbi:hypothetical protein BDFB_013245 [Asbolus verrucosus]|uniref:Uncharacterized protein n=1 Tax=Asbolus verrucosus TaxID=1661398 RepID=A0A482V0E4_ASBVE|nr:hypothetical protein BDFB_013245 [Asbolus verrucosus]